MVVGAAPDQQEDCRRELAGENLQEAAQEKPRPGPQKATL